MIETSTTYPKTSETYPKPVEPVNTYPETPEAIENDIQETRSRLDSTLDKLSDRIDPNDMVGRLFDWVNEKIDAIEPDKARQSLSHTGQKAADAVKNHPVAVGLGLASVTAAAWPDSWAPSKESREKIGSKARGLKVKSTETTKDAMSTTSQRVGDATDRASSRVNEWGETAKMKTQELHSSGVSLAKDASSKTNEGFQKACREHPLAVCAGAMATGLLAGLLLPRSEREDRAFGEQADQVRREIANESHALVKKAGQKMRDARMHPAGLEERAENAVNETADQAEQTVAEV
ncbi:MAG: DUF3618 domain-containing protein [Verrucomicrobiota bacterium JB023]|nr:DUF3618 domain-containing protein [Verrucomicrobiota bacterium JB023]